MRHGMVFEILLLLLFLGDDFSKSKVKSMIMMGFPQKNLHIHHKTLRHHAIFSIWHEPPLSYLHGNKIKNKKKLTPIQIMNNVGLNNKNIVNNVSVFNDNYTMNMGSNNEMNNNSRV